MLQASTLTNELVAWDTKTETRVAVGTTGAPTDVLPLSDDALLVATAGVGDIVKVNAMNFSGIQVMATMPGAYFLAGDESEVYASNFMSGTISKIIAGSDFNWVRPTRGHCSIHRR